MTRAARPLESYVRGGWQSGRGPHAALRDATTGELVAEASSSGIDFAAVLEYARDRGGPALRALTFHQRAGLLKALAKRLSECKEELYALSYCTGATRDDSWIDIDGGIGTVFAYAGKGARELPNGHVYLDGAAEALSKAGGFVGQHIYVPREGAAVHINAFNFPVWGMLEKLAPALLAGVPVIVKPATATAYLTELAVRRIIESGILPEGALQLVCGGLYDLFDHLTCQDSVSFTGSAHTAARLRTHPCIVRHAVPFTAEADSLNSSILAPDAAPGTAEFDLFIREVAREMTVKAGQKCTAIRKALVPDAVCGSGGRGARGRPAQGDRRRPACARCAHGTLGESCAARRCAGAVRGIAPRDRPGGRQRGRLRGHGRRSGARRVPASAAAAVPRAASGASGARSGGVRTHSHA